jgi:hypothetical protein
VTGAPVLGPAMARTRTASTARLVAAASALGVRFRFSGAAFQVAGAGALHPDDRTLLRQHLPAIQTHLEPPEASAGLLEELDVEVEVVTDADRARQVIASLSPGMVGFDIETMPTTGSNGANWIKVTKAGKRAVHQPAHGDDAGLDPLRSRPRLAQLYDPAQGIVYVIDLAAVPMEVLRALENQRLVAHTAAFECAALLAQGIRIRRIACTKIMARRWSTVPSAAISTWPTWLIGISASRSPRISRPATGRPGAYPRRSSPMRPAMLWSRIA